MNIPALNVPPDEKVKPLKFKWGQALAESEGSWERKQKTTVMRLCAGGREVVSKSKQNDLTCFRKTLVVLK